MLQRVVNPWPFPAESHLKDLYSLEVVNCEL
jgi:hypothetical protein